MKLICKCGNIEELVSDKKLELYEVKNFEDGTIAIICKKCSEIKFISFEKR